ncbi:hypothetical protein B0H65DRAFT_504318 [Neurospora tetraspora]|uniref:Uncharacterized protein n=1 Tax=Neurospora tetraspora TaxID=94610 RepID=A0AAE0JN26_9PEZI|nr:hypothetical protein B0H65DRAFT_504318 [Neurospora tetraspora]
MGSLAVGRESQGAISAAAFVMPDGQQHVPHVPANGIGAFHALLDLDDMSVDRSFFMPLSLLEPKASPAGCPAGCSGCPPGDSTPFTGAATPSPTPPDHHVRQRLEQLDDEPLVEPWTYVPQTPLSIDNRSPRDFAFHLPFRFLPNAKHDQNTNIGTFLDDSSYPYTGSSERHHLPDLGLDEFGPFHVDVDLPRSPVYRSFYLSPSTSTTSLASEPCTYHHYFDNSSTSFSSIKHGAIMPDPTAVASADGAGPSGRPNFAAKTIAQRRQRPHSAHSEQLARLPSPFFSLWTKRHHHQHMDHNGKPQQPFEYPGHGFTDTKPTTHKRFTHSRSSSIGTRQSQANAVPQMTREEFEALPLAIQRKVHVQLEASSPLLLSGDDTHPRAPPSEHHSRPVSDWGSGELAPRGLFAERFSRLSKQLRFCFFEASHATLVDEQVPVSKGKSRDPISIHFRTLAASFDSPACRSNACQLRFARESYLIDGITRHYDEISNFKRQKGHKQQSRSEQIVSRNGRGPLGGEPSLPSPVLEVPQSPLDNMRQQELTREEQVALARRLRASVILDAADEAIYKMNRRTSGHPSVNREGLMSSHSSLQTTTEPRDGVQSRAEQPISQELPQSFYDSFRWIDEEDDLDLRLFLDDYHKNLRDSLPSPKQTRPSFRRQMSVSKRPFGLSSMPTPTSRPGSHNDLATGSPAPTSAGSVANSDGHTNRKARTLSLITPKHSSHESVFDPSAAHYQDPEARLKLRVYLASPQKFDEAIEFGFPSTDALGAGPIIRTEFMETPLGPGRRKVQSTQKGEDTWAMGTFLADDDDEHVSLNSDQPSLADPESPKTPQAFESRPHPQRATSSDPTFLRDGCGMFAEGAGGYAQAPANSREMTLRMTLTRPDLRAHENEIYGWQQKPVYRNTRKSMSLGGFENKGMFYGEPILNESLENQASTTSEKGVMKRIWKRVRRT